ncbi:MAG: hypothetical protein ACI4RT_02260 [Candidatus Spyradenecus sp.]
MATKKTNSKSGAEKPATVYIGKSIPGLPRYTTFKGGELPPHIKALVAQDATLAGLIVPVTELQEARKNILKPGNILNVYAKKQK